MRPRRGVLLRIAGGWLAIAVVAFSSGCGRATPGCDQAAADLAAARLAAAAEDYARADDRGEGDCADAGLHTVGARYVTAYQNVARGRSAEDGHDLDGAATAYRAALENDADNTAARDGLARLGHPEPPPVAVRTPVPTATPSSVPSAPALPGPARSSLVVGLLVASLGLLALVVVLVALVLWWTRRGAAAAQPLGDVTRQLEELVADRPTWTDERLAEMTALLRELASGRDDAAAVRAVAVGPTGDGEGVVRQLRRDLGDVVAFLDQRLPGRGPSHDRFGAPPAGTEREE